jgi:hypothetical protein
MYDSTLDNDVITEDNHPTSSHLTSRAGPGKSGDLGEHPLFPQTNLATSIICVVK